MSAPVLSWLFNALRKVRAFHCWTRARPPERRGAGRPRVRAAREGRAVPRIPPVLCHRRPTSPTLRANPFPEVTDLFCRLPLSTLFYRPEASHLGDLMRLWVRPGVRISHSAGFSRDVASVPNGSKIKPLSHTSRPLSPGNPIPGAAHTVNKNRKLLSELAPPSPASLVSPLDIHVLVREY